MPCPSSATPPPSPGGPASSADAPASAGARVRVRARARVPPAEGDDSPNSGGSAGRPRIMRRLRPAARVRRPEQSEARAGADRSRVGRVACSARRTRGRIAEPGSHGRSTANNASASPSGPRSAIAGDGPGFDPQDRGGPTSRVDAPPCLARRDRPLTGAEPVGGTPGAAEAGLPSEAEASARGGSPKSGARAEPTHYSRPIRSATRVRRSTAAGSGSPRRPAGTTTDPVSPSARCRRGKPGPRFWSGPGGSPRVTATSPAGARRRPARTPTARRAAPPARRRGRRHP